MRPKDVWRRSGPGDRESARSIDRDPTADETYVWLAIAYRKKGNRLLQNKALDEALRRKSTQHVCP